ncbi:MAG: DUF1460 domain-containing protein [Alphaproteobacteria bacterium]|nr:DUF1460 domain-containing protein [Alphaproteobacteria bacterium]
MSDATFTGHSFLGVPYAESPLGEGVMPDTDPLIRFDAFDCTTFVETVLAGGDVNKLNKIRYKNGNVGFLNRNHFIESDWLINNADLVENVSARYADTAVRHVVIDKQSWLKKVHNIDAYLEPVEIDLEYIPYHNVKNIKIDNMMVVLFVADKPKIHDKIGTDLAVFHMGLLFPDGILRHASSEHKKVIDVDFAEYVAERMKNKTNLGIVLVEIK